MQPVPEPSLTFHFSPAENEILEAGAKVFAERGFAATRVEDILETAGVARRTFYRYFASKESVLAAIYDFATAELTEAIRAAALQSTGDPFDALRLGLDAYLDYHVANAPLLRVLVEQALRSDSPTFERRASFREDLITLVDAAVQAAGRKTKDPLYYTALISAVEGVSLALLTKGAGTKAVARAKAALHELLERALG